MNRRGFLTIVSRAIVGVAVATAVPASWMPTEALRRDTALAYLRRACNEWVRVHGRSPETLHVGQELFKAAENELPPIMRFCSGDPAIKKPSLCFKGALMFPVGRGWHIKAILGSESDRVV